MHELQYSFSTYMIQSLTIGVGATIVMDIWVLLLATLWGIKGLDFAFVGRWVGHFKHGVFRHRSIIQSKPIRMERPLGWFIHYVTGVVSAALLIGIVGDAWLASPTLGPALLIGAVTVVLPFFIMQPCFGMGIAASKTPNPRSARVKSTVTHLIFRCGLYLSAECFARFL